MKQIVNFILFLFLLSSTCYSQEIEYNGDNKYNYSLEITEHFLGQNDRVVCKYYINKNSGRIQLDSIQMLDPEKTYLIKYYPDSTIEAHGEIILNSYELDTIFNLVKDLIKVDEIIAERNYEPEDNDGKYAIISFFLDDYYTRYWISVNLEHESVNRKKYYRIKDYISRKETTFKKVHKQ